MFLKLSYHPTKIPLLKVNNINKKVWNMLKMNDELEQCRYR